MLIEEAWKECRMIRTRVSILDDHQSIIDGYVMRLGQIPEIELGGTANFGVGLEPMLAELPDRRPAPRRTCVTSPQNVNPYPILHVIPKLLDRYVNLNVLVISMYAQPTLVRAVMEAGASGYLLKDDYGSIRELGFIVQSVATGGIHFSQSIYQDLFKRKALDLVLTSRQLEVLSLAAAYPEAASGELAVRLGIAHSTLRNLLSDAYLRLGVRNRAGAVVKARHMGLITPFVPSMQPEDLQDTPAS
jgi:DNA-binding NarL/FixJ family response regulator